MKYAQLGSQHKAEAAPGGKAMRAYAIEWLARHAEKTSTDYYSEGW